MFLNYVVSLDRLAGPGLGARPGRTDDEKQEHCKTNLKKQCEKFISYQEQCVFLVFLNELFLSFLLDFVVFLNFLVWLDRPA